MLRNSRLFPPRFPTLFWTFVQKLASPRHCSRSRSSGNRHRRRCRRPKGAKTHPPLTINIRAWTRIRGQLLGAAGPIERMTCDQNSGVPGGDGAGRDFSSERSGVGQGVVLMAPQLAIRLMVPACANATSDDEYPLATIITLDGNVGPGTSTVPIAGPAPPEPWEIFSAARNTSLPLSTVAQFARVVARVVNYRFGGFWKSGSAWGQAPRRWQGVNRAA